MFVDDGFRKEHASCRNNRSGDDGKQLINRIVISPFTGHDKEETLGKKEHSGDFRQGAQNGNDK